MEKREEKEHRDTTSTEGEPGEERQHTRTYTRAHARCVARRSPRTRRRRRSQNASAGAASTARILVHTPSCRRSPPSRRFIPCVTVAARPTESRSSGKEEEEGRAGTEGVGGRCAAGAALDQE